MTTMAEVEVFRALIEAKARYCRLLDDKNWTELGDLVTDDVALDTGDEPSAGVVAGRDEVLEFIRSDLAQATTAHHVHLPELETDGDTAAAIWPIQERIVLADGRTLTYYGHHHERWVHRAGRWRMQSLRRIRLLVDDSAAATR